MKTADCYVSTIELNDSMIAIVHLEPLGNDYCYGEWNGNKLKAGQKLVWKMDVTSLGLLCFIDFYVSFRMSKFENQIPNSRFHEFFRFDKDNNVIGIAR